MKRRITTIILAMLLVVGSAVCLSACVIIAGTAKCAHAYSDWTVKTAATCTEKGEEVRTCSKCGDEQTQKIAALGHEYSEEWTTDENGHWHACTRAGCAVKSEETEHGETDHYCPVCDYKTSEHVYGEATYTWSSDYSVCTATRSCSKCSEKADGHTQTSNAAISTSVQNATCESPELTTYTATFAEEWAIAQTKENVKTKDALNHDYDEATYTWSSDYSVCTATRSCSKCSEKADGHTQTSNAAISTSVQNATCESPELTTYTATFAEEWAIAQTKENVKTKDALNHDYDEATYTWSDDYSVCTATRSCSKCSEKAEGHTQTSNAVISTSVVQNATCESPELTTYTATFAEDWAIIQKKENVKTKDALNHDYGKATYTWSSDYSVCTATRSCSKCSEKAEGHTQTSNAAMSTSVQNATCESPELTTYTATFAEDWAIAQTKENVKTKDALNHDYGEVTYTWSSDYSVCTATRSCSKCSEKAEGHTQTSNAVISTSVVQNATCESPELTTYTATFAEDWAIAQTKKNVKTKDALNHDYGEVTYTWSSDYSVCTATRSCSKCSEKAEGHTQTSNAVISTSVVQNATCESPELTTYTATFAENWALTQTKENVVTDKAAGHDWYLGYNDTWCERCGYCTFTKQLSFTYNEENDNYTVKKLDDSNVTDVIVPAYYCGKPVVGIDSQAFMDKSKIKSVTLPDSISTIGSSAFDGCKQLESIEIPANVTKIGVSAFQDCEKLSAVYISDLSAWCKIQFGIGSYSTSGNYINPLYYAKNLYLKDASGNYRLIEDLVIPSDVEAVQGLTFFGAKCLKSVTISAGVTSIGAYAFGLCSNLKSVTIPASVTSIGAYAFNACNGLAGVYIDDVSAWCKIVFADGSEYSYHANPLYYAKNLYLKGASNNYELVTSLVIPSGVTTINAFAFYKATCLSSVTIPESVTSIGTQAFCECRGLIEVVNNSELEIKTGDYSHGYVAAYAKTVITDGSGSKLKVEGNFVYEEGDTENTLVSYTGTATELVLPDKIGGKSYSIGNSAFQNNASITSIKIPSSVKSIGKYAFSGCSKLTSVTIPASVKSIGQYAFNDCNKLTGVYVSDLAAWCGISFEGTSSDVTTNPLYYAHNLYLNDKLIETLVIPNGVTTINKFAFYSATCLRSVILPASVTSIGNEAFNYCNNLVEVVNNSKLSSIMAGSTSNGYVAYYAVLITTGESKLKVEGDFAYVEGETENTLVAYTGTATELVLPDTLGGKNYAIHDKVFMNNTALTSVTISKGVTAIGKNAFNGCSALTTVIASENDSALKTIDNKAFFWCKELTSITIPKGVESIGDEAFYACVKLATLNIKADGSLKTIGQYAFNGCSKLTSITIPKGVTSIGQYAFKDCSGLTGVYISDSDAWCKIAFGDCANPLYYAHNLYLNDTLVTEFAIPESVVEIGQYTFYGATCLTKITIHANVKSIGQYAFYGCSGLTSITIPKGVTSIGDRAFNDCSGLTGVYISDLEAWCKIAFGVGANPLHSAKEKNLYLNNTLLTELEIPASVTEIGQYAFYGAACLTKITIHSNVTSIGNSAFCGCSGLTSVVIPESVTSIGNSAFSGCSGLTEVTFDGNSKIVAIGNGLFSGCSKLTAITLPKGVTSIGNSAFYGCKGLTSVAIPEGVTSIGEYAFYGCSGLTSVTIPEGVTSIGQYAFYGCSKLTSVAIPASVKSIGQYAFLGCSGLTGVYISDLEAWCKIAFGYGANPLHSAKEKNLYLNNTLLTELVIPSSITEIGQYAFYGAACLTKITIHSNVTSIGTYAFNGCSSLKEVYYTGTADKWTAIRIASGNTSLTSATIYYYSE